MKRGRGRGGGGSRRRHGEDNGFEGGYMNAKKAKLEEQFKEDAEKEGNDVREGIFSGVSIFVNGYTGENSLPYKLK